VAIQAHRRFHRDEEHLALEPTSGFPLRSVVAVTDPVSVHVAVPAPQTGPQPVPRTSESRRHTPSNPALADPSSAAHPGRMPGRDAGRQPPWPDRCSDGRPVAPAQHRAGAGLSRTAGLPRTRCPGANRVADTWCRRRRCGRPCPRDQRDDGGQVVRAGTLPAAELRRVGRRIRDRPGTVWAAVIGTFVQTLTGPASFDPGQPSSSVPTSIVPPKGC